MNIPAAIILALFVAAIILIVALRVFSIQPRRLLIDFLGRVPRRERVFQYPLDLDILGDGAGTAPNLPRVPPPAYIARSYETLPLYTTHTAAGVAASDPAAASSSLISSMDTPPARPPTTHAP